MSLLQPTIRPDKVSGVILFVREVIPPCHKCEEARTWLRENLGETGLTVIEYPINEKTAEWAKFLSNNPKSRSVPQIVIVMKNGSTMNIGTYSDLVQIFSLPEKIKERS